MITSLSLCKMQRIPALFRPTVYCVGVREGSSADFEFLFKQYNALNISTDRANKTNVLYGLTCSKDLSQLSRCLAAAMKDPANDIDFTLQAIRNVAIRPNGNALAWSFVKSNWDYLYEK